MAVGMHRNRMDVGLLRRGKAGVEQLWCQLIEPVGRRIACASKEYRPPVHRQRPPACADVPGQLPKRKCVVHASRFDRSRSARDQLGTIDRLLTEAPWIPPARAGKREPHRHRLVCPTSQANLALEPKRLPARHRYAELDLAFHLPAVEVAQPRLDIEATVAAFEMRLEPHPVDGDRSDILELDRAP